MLNKKYWGLYFAEIIFILLSSYYLRCLFPINQSASSLFIFDLLDKNIFISFWIIYPLGILNIFLIYFLNKHVVSREVGFLTTLIYAVSPWTYYSGLINPLVILQVSIILLFFSGLKLCKKSDRLGHYLILIALISSVLTSPYLLVAVPFVIFYLLKKNILDNKKRKIMILVMVLFAVAILILSLRNPAAIRNTLSLNNSFYSDIGTINTVNAFRGETQNGRLSLIGKFTENKYFYFIQVNLKSLLDHLNPITYFTDTGNLVRKTISPPILTGFIFPFLFGLFYSWKFIKKKPYLLFILLLIIPSFLSIKYPEIIKLFVIAPLIFEITGFGLYKMLQVSKHNSLVKFLIIILVFIIFIQLVYLLSALSFTEPKRLYYMRYVI
jgi:hypothetical protein